MPALRNWSVAAVFAACALAHAASGLQFSLPPRNSVRSEDSLAEETGRSAAPPDVRGVAMRFRDDGPMVSDATYIR